MHNRRRVCLGVATFLYSACGDAGGAPDGAPDVDGAPGCVPSGVSEADATRVTDAAAVTVSAVLRNSLEHCVKPKLTFSLVFDTHSVDLLAIDIVASSRIETGVGGRVSLGVAWAPGPESGPHRDGVLTLQAPQLDGAEWLRLTVAGVAGVDRVFEWDGALLTHDQP